MQELLQELETAKLGTPELDLAFLKQIYPMQDYYIDKSRQVYHYLPGGGSINSEIFKASKPTRVFKDAINCISYDFALTLHMNQHQTTNALDQIKNSKQINVLITTSDFKVHNGFGATPSLAICAANLRKLQKD